MSTAKKDKELLHIAIFFAIVALFFFVIPPVEPLTKPGVRIFGLFLAAIYGWTVTEEPWPTLFTIVLFLFTGLANLTTLLAASWGSDSFLFMLLMFIVIAYLQTSGFSNFLSAWMLSRKFLTGHPYRIIFTLMILSWLLSIFAGIFAGMLLTWGFVYQICQMMGYKPFSKEASAMIFAIAMTGGLSLSAVPFLHNALVILAAFTGATGIEINLMHYLAFSIPTNIICMLVYLAMCKFVFRIDVSKMKEMTVDFIPAEHLILTKQVKYAICFLVVLIACLFIPNLLPSGMPLQATLKGLGNSGITILVFAFWSLLKIDGKRVFEFGELAKSGINWNQLFLVVGVFAFIALLSNPATGISAFIGAYLGPVFIGKPAILFIALIIIATIILTNFMANMVVAVIMFAAALPIIPQLGLNVTQMGYLLTLCSSIAFCLPSSSPAGLLLFANKEWMNPAEIMKYAIPTAFMMGFVAYAWNAILFMF